MIYDEYIKSDEWKKLREEARRRSNDMCEFCQEQGYAVHHVFYPKEFKNDHINNLVVVCKRCHALVHGIRKANFQYLLSKLRENGILLDKEMFDYFHKVIEITKLWNSKDIDLFFEEIPKKLKHPKIILASEVKKHYVF